MTHQTYECYGVHEYDSPTLHAKRKSKPTAHRYSVVTQTSMADTNSLRSLSFDGRLSRRNSAHSLRSGSGRTLGIERHQISPTHNYASVSHLQTVDTDPDADRLKGTVFNIRFRRERMPQPYAEPKITHVTKTVRRSVAARCSQDTDQIHQAVRAARMTERVARAFCRDVDTRGWTIDVVVPTVTQVKVRRPLRKQKSVGSLRALLSLSNTQIANTLANSDMVAALSEPYVPGLEKVLGNSGWFTEKNGIPEKLLIALARYSYFFSCREYLVADMHAAIDYRHKCITIVSPTITSRQAGAYGLSDLGIKGIRNFFYWHRSNRFCHGLPKSRHADIYFQPTSETLLLE